MDKKIIFVRAKPHARKNEIVALDETHFEISVTAPAQNDRANIAVLEAVAKHFGISLYNLRLVSGKTARNKVIQIRNEESGENR